MGGRGRGDLLDAPVRSVAGRFAAQRARGARPVRGPTGASCAVRALRRPGSLLAGASMADWCRPRAIPEHDALIGLRAGPTWVRSLVIDEGIQGFRIGMRTRTLPGTVGRAGVPPVTRG